MLPFLRNNSQNQIFFKPSMLKKNTFHANKTAPTSRGKYV